MFFQKDNILGYPVFTDTLTKIGFGGQQCIINTINQYSYCIAQEDEAFDKALKRSDILLPDGIGIVWAAKWKHGKSIKKIAGADLHRYLLERLNQSKGRVFYMGSSEEVLAKIKTRLAQEYPYLSVATYSPPYKPEFTKKDNRAIVDAIDIFDPKVIFVGMTAPKQEKWVSANRELLGKRTICSIGAVFDFYAGTVKRPNKIWQNLGLEWLGRLIKEPKRMWRRYVYYGVIFAVQIVGRKTSK